jgi:hypothetical protein
MKTWFQKSRKAVGAGVGVFLGTFPLVDVIEGDQVGDPKVLATQAGLAAATAVLTYFLKNETA